MLISIPGFLLENALIVIVKFRRLPGAFQIVETLEWFVGHEPRPVTGCSNESILRIIFIKFCLRGLSIIPVYKVKIRMVKGSSLPLAKQVLFLPDLVDK